MKPSTPLRHASSSQSHQPSATTRHLPAPLVGEVEMRAYYAYLNDGSVHGSDVANWLDAESSLRLEQTMPSSSTARFNA